MTPRDWKLALGSAAVGAFLAWAALGRDDGYDACILNNMRGVAHIAAAGAVEAACERQHGRPPSAR